MPRARLLPPLRRREGGEAAPRAEGQIHEDEGGCALGHDGRGAAFVRAGAPHAAVVVVARRVRVSLAVVSLSAAEKREICLDTT